MQILISVDMEGISGVVTGDHASSGHKEYERFRKLMTAEANAAAEGALAGGAARVVVNDSHGGMANILIEDLNPAVELISGSPKPFGMMEGISPGVDKVFLVGYHAASGTGSAVLEHTWSGRVIEVRLNDHIVGETGLNAALAGAYGAPAARRRRRCWVRSRLWRSRTASHGPRPGACIQRWRRSRSARRLNARWRGTFRPLSCRPPSRCASSSTALPTSTWPSWSLEASGWTAAPSSGSVTTCRRSTRCSGR